MDQKTRDQLRLRYTAVKSPEATIILTLLREQAALQASQERAQINAALAARDAGRWRALWGCDRINLVGGSGLGSTEDLIGLDIHRHHPARDDQAGRIALLRFLDYQSPTTLQHEGPDAIPKLEDTMSIKRAEIKQLQKHTFCEECGDTGFTGAHDYDGICSGCAGQSVNGQELLALARAEVNRLQAVLSSLRATSHSLRRRGAECRRMAENNPPKHEVRLIAKAQAYEHAAELIDAELSRMT